MVEETAEQVTQGSANDYERAVKLQDWFASEGGFRYDTTVTSGTGTAAIERFLKDKEGFCVHFSFTMAAMARTLGIPARVAVGFTPGTVQADGSVSVGLRDAHAWPELYFEGVGWTRFEPTPSRGSTPAYTRPDAPSQNPSDPALPTDGASAAPTAAPSASESCPAQMRRQGECGASAAPGAADPTEPGTPVGTVVLWVLGALAVLTLPLVPMFLRTRIRSRRLGSSGGRTAADASARVMAAWREITDTAWDHGIPPDESQTPARPPPASCGWVAWTARRWRRSTAWRGRWSRCCTRPRRARPPRRPRTFRRSGQGSGPWQAVGAGCGRRSHRVRLSG